MSSSARIDAKGLFSALIDWEEDTKNIKVVFDFNGIQVMNIMSEKEFKDSITSLLGEVEVFGEEMAKEWGPEDVGDDGLYPDEEQLIIDFGEDGDALAPNEDHTRDDNNEEVDE